MNSHTVPGLFHLARCPPSSCMLSQMAYVWCVCVCVCVCVSVYEKCTPIHQLFPTDSTWGSREKLETRKNYPLLRHKVDNKTELEMALMLKISDRDFKITGTRMPQDLEEKINKIMDRQF